MPVVPLIIAPTHSKETRLLSTSAVNLYNYFRLAGARPYILLGFGARRIPLLSMLRSFKGYRLAIFYYGHGTPKTLIGSELITRPMRQFHLLTENLTDPMNKRIVRLLKGSIIYTVACDSAEDLGEWLVEHGVRAFVGSTKPMWITQDLDFNRDHVPDMTTILTLGPRRLLEGYPLSQAVEDYRSIATMMANDYSFKSDFPELTEILDQNVKYYNVIGDGEWRWNDSEDWQVRRLEQVG